MKKLPPLNADRLWARIEALSSMTQPEAPWTRRAFTPLFVKSRKWLTKQFEAAGMEVHVDAGGNLVGRLPPRKAKPLSKPIVTGSHCDTVMMGGRFDGIIGVLAGIEVAQTLHESGVELAHPFEVIDFLSEEPSDYGISCVGSRSLSGNLSKEMLLATKPGGATLAQGIREVGGDPDALQMPLRPSDSTAAFVELHIEQGPVLEARGIPIGVVTNIVGIQRVAVVIDGQPDHAGTTPMDIRRDALVGAACFIQEVNRRASALDGDPHYVVATVGHLTLTPNASNAVPGRVEMMMEVRSGSEDVLDSFPTDALAAIASQLESLRVKASATLVSRSKPTDCSQVVMEAIEAAASGLDYQTMRLPSGAGHDAVYLAPTGPMGMIFIPCRGGRSHCPEEWIELQQLVDGTSVLYQTILELDHQLESAERAGGAFKRNVPPASGRKALAA